MEYELFSIAWALGVVSWIIAFIEMIAMHTFSKFSFQIGIPIYKHTFDIDTINLNVEHNITIRRSEGKFQFTQDNKVYFLSQFFFFKFFRFTTPFPFKAIGEIRTDHKTEIVARIPIGTTLFLLFWLIGWTAGAIGASINSGSIGDIAFGLIGWVFAGIMVLISYPIEKRRMDRMVEELESIISGKKIIE